MNKGEKNTILVPNKEEMLYRATILIKNSEQKGILGNKLSAGIFFHLNDSWSLKVLAIWRIQEIKVQLFDVNAVIQEKHNLEWFHSMQHSFTAC